MAIQRDTLVELLHKNPFRPFLVVTASGKEYYVENPELVVVMPSEMFYAYPNQDRWTTIPISHITSVEVGQPA